MIAWEERAWEEQSLLNPCFCSNLLWHAATGYESDSECLLSLEEAFLVLPMVLHEQTRQSLPKTTRTSLAVWLQSHPLLASRIATRATFLVPYTKEALLFAGTRTLIDFTNTKIHANGRLKRTINCALKDSSDEVRTCAKRALFVGRWFAASGGPTTVLAMMGVKP